jgi:hypothetical protein
MDKERHLRVAAAMVAELQLEIETRTREGTTLPTWQRYAAVFSPPNVVREYLPGNYEVVGWLSTEGEFTTLVAGYDNAGWTLDDYVIPRLASGLHTAVEITPRSDT